MAHVNQIQPSTPTCSSLGCSPFYLLYVEAIHCLREDEALSSRLFPETKTRRVMTRLEPGSALRLSPVCPSRVSQRSDTTTNQIKQPVDADSGTQEVILSWECRETGRRQCHTKCNAIAAIAIIGAIIAC